MPNSMVGDTLAFVDCTERFLRRRVRPSHSSVPIGRSLAGKAPRLTGQHAIAAGRGTRRSDRQRAAAAVPRHLPANSRSISLTGTPVRRRYDRRDGSDLSSSPAAAATHFIRNSRLDFC
jgi:hypothetical protein